MMKFKQEGLKIVTYREPKPRRIELEMAAIALAGMVLMGMALMGLATEIRNLCAAFGF